MTDDSKRIVDPGRDRLGQDIRAARLRKQLTQLDLSRLAGVDRKQLWALETGSAGVTLETFRRVVTALELETIDFGSSKLRRSRDEAEQLLATCETAIDALTAVVSTLRGTLSDTPEPSEANIDRMLAAASRPRAVLDENHPTVRKLRALADHLVGKTASKHE